MQSSDYVLAVEARGEFANRLWKCELLTSY